MQVLFDWRSCDTTWHWLISVDTLKGNGCQVVQISPQSLAHRLYTIQLVFDHVVQLVCCFFEVAGKQHFIIKGLCWKFTVLQNKWCFFAIFTCLQVSCGPFTIDPRHIFGPRPTSLERYRIPVTSQAVLVPVYRYTYEN